MDLKLRPRGGVVREQSGEYCKAVGVVVRKSKGKGAKSRTPDAEKLPEMVCATEPTSAGDTRSTTR